MAPGTVQHGFGTSDPSQPVSQYDVTRIDNAVFGCKNAVKFYRTSVVEHLLARWII